MAAAPPLAYERRQSALQNARHLSLKCGLEAGFGADQHYTALKSRSSPGSHTCISLQSGRPSSTPRTRRRQGCHRRRCWRCCSRRRAERRLKRQSLDSGDGAVLWGRPKSLLRNYRSEQVRSRCRPVSAKSTLYAVWHAAGKSFSNRLPTLLLSFPEPCA